MNKVINLKLTWKILSINFYVVGFALLANSLLALWFSEDIMPFIYSSLISLISGFIFHKMSAGVKGTSIKRKDAYFTVTISWFLVGFLGALPYLFSGSIPSLADAYFESVSGFTTTGSSILTDIEALPKSILFWRSLTHWIGGIGIIVLVIIILPSLKIGGYHLFTSESSFQDKIKPRIHQVAHQLFAIYLTLTLLEVLLLMAGHMNLYESVCHAFATVATGGFSPRNTSICDYSPYIQYVIMIFMFLSGTNYIIYYYLVKREFTKIRKNDEFKFYFFMVFIIGAVVTAILILKMGKPLEVAFREAYFQVISIITCTGFASADYLLWPTVGWVIIFFAMFLGGSTGSTAGGIKMARHLIFFKAIKTSYKKIMHPHAIFSLKMNGKSLGKDLVNSNLSFIIMYIFIFFIGMFSLVLMGLDSATASSSVATCMAGIGPGIGTVGPASNFAHLPVDAKVLLSFIMVLGRLEIYPVLVLFTKNFWKS